MSRQRKVHLQSLRACMDVTTCGIDLEAKPETAVAEMLGEITCERCAESGEVQDRIDLAERSRAALRIRVVDVEAEGDGAAELAGRLLAVALGDEGDR